MHWRDFDMRNWRVVPKLRDPCYIQLFWRHFIWENFQCKIFDFFIWNFFNKKVVKKWFWGREWREGREIHPGSGRSSKSDSKWPRYRGGKKMCIFEIARSFWGGFWRSYPGFVRQTEGNQEIKLFLDLDPIWPRYREKSEKSTFHIFRKKLYIKCLKNKFGPWIWTQDEKTHQSWVSKVC